MVADTKRLGCIVYCLCSGSWSLNWNYGSNKGLGMVITCCNCAVLFSLDRLGYHYAGSGGICCDSIINRQETIGAARLQGMKKILHNGSTYYSVADAARYLGTTTPKVRGMMGDGSLEWAQFRANGKLFITAKSLVEKERALLAEKNNTISI